MQRHGWSVRGVPAGCPTGRSTLWYANDVEARDRRAEKIRGCRTGLLRFWSEWCGCKSRRSSQGGRGVTVARLRFPVRQSPHIWADGGRVPRQWDGEYVTVLLSKGAIDRVTGEARASRAQSTNIRGSRLGEPTTRHVVVVEANRRARRLGRSTAGRYCRMAVTRVRVPAPPPKLRAVV